MYLISPKEFGASEKYKKPDEPFNKKEQKTCYPQLFKVAFYFFRIHMEISAKEIKKSNFTKNDPNTIIY